MSDTSTNRFTATGTAAEMAAFTPNPGTPTPTPAQGYTFFNQDDATLYAWDGANWVPAVAAAGNVSTGATLTADQVIVGAGTTDVSVLAAGTDGDVFTMVTGVPTWQAPSGGGGLVLLEQHTASASASLDFTTFYSSTYDDYQVEIVDLIVATNNVSLQLLYSSNGGSSWNTTSNYYSAHGGINNSGTAFNTNTNPGAAWVLGANVSNSSSRSFSGTIYLKSLASTALDKSAYGTVTYSNQSVVGVGAWFGLFTVPGTAFNAAQVKASSGNLASGTIRIYGIEK